jgi:hypothetical protein
MKKPKPTLAQLARDLKVNPKMLRQKIREAGYSKNKSKKA